jgi:hypothetical protein
VVPLDNLANEPYVYLRFTLQSDASGVAGGWYIDDVAVLQASQLSGYLSPTQLVDLIGANFNNHIQDSTVSNGDGLFQFGLLPLGSYQLVSAGVTNGPYAITGPDITVTFFVPPEFTFVDNAAVGQTPVTVTWTASSGIVYRLDYTTNLLSGLWSPLNVQTGDAAPTLSYLDPSSTPFRIYRVAATNAP